MAYHADFWMLAGTASPVVALAAIVAAATTLAALAGDKRLSTRLIKGVTYFICLLNVTLQAVVAQAALTSLATGHDSQPLHGQTDHVLTGLGLIFATLVARILVEFGKGQAKARATGSLSAADDAGPQPEAT